MIIYDIEIENPIPPDNGMLVPGITYSKGWNYPATMGLAVIGVYDYTADKYRVFGEFELEDFKALVNQHDKCVGFNNIGFDNKILETCDLVIPPTKSYDILSEIYSALGSRQKGCKLEDVVKANFPSQSGKTEDPAKIPILWQQGYKMKVADYCLNDVRLTKMILDKILRFGWIFNPVKPSETLRIKRP